MNHRASAAIDPSHPATETRRPARPRPRGGGRRRSGDACASPCAGCLALAVVAPSGPGSGGCARLAPDQAERPTRLRWHPAQRRSSHSARHCRSCPVAPARRHPAPDAALILFALLFLCLRGRAPPGATHLCCAHSAQRASARPVVIYGAGIHRPATGRGAPPQRTHPPRRLSRRQSVAARPARSPASACMPARRPAPPAPPHDATRVILAMPAPGARAAARHRPALPRSGLEVQAVPSLRRPAAAARGAALLPVSRRPLPQPQPVPPPTPDRQRLCRAHDPGDGRGRHHRVGALPSASRLPPARLMLFEKSEHALYTIDKDLRPLPGPPRCCPVLGSVTDRGRSRRALRPPLRRHRLPRRRLQTRASGRGEPVAAIETNVFGTRLLAEAAAAAGVRRFVLVSTDKAVRPGNVMGATKRLAELVVQESGAALTGHALRHRAVRQRARLLRLGRAAVSRADRARRAGHADPSRGDTLLHDNGRGRAACPRYRVPSPPNPRARCGCLRARHGRAGSHPRPCACR